MGVQRIKELVLLLIGLVYGIYVDGQQISYVKMKGDTYKIDMMADWAHLPYEFLGKVSNDIINKVKGVNRVTYDISSKPPATIEWE